MADPDSTAAWHSVHRRAHGHGVPGRRGRASRRPPPNDCGSVAPPDRSGEHPIARVIRTGEAALMSEVPASWREHWAGSPEEQDLWEQRSILIVEDHPDACDGLRIAL